VRLSPPLTILAIVAAAFGALAVNNDRETKLQTLRLQRSCGLLLTFLQAETKGLGSKYMVVDFPELSPESQEIAIWQEQRPDLRDHPVWQLYRELGRYRRSMVMPTQACPALKSWLNKLRIKVNPPEADFILRESRLHDAKLPMPIYSIAMPATNSDGDEGLLKFVVAQEDRAGGMFEVWAKRDGDGPWTFEYQNVSGVP
jgi:hypothetical protein